MAYHEAEPGVVRMAVINPEGLLDEGNGVIKANFEEKEVGSSATGWQVESVRLYDISGGTVTAVSSVTGVEMPKRLEVHQNVPNPFNASTTITYQLVQPGNVSLTIYNVLGQNVATLVDRFQDVGEYSVEWNGRNSSGQTVSSGMYFYRITAGNASATRKMMLLK